MKKFSRLMIFALSLVVVGTANAQSRNNRTRTTTAPVATTNYSSGTVNRPLHEIQTYSTRGAFETGKACKDCASGTVIDIGGAYLYTLQDNIQVGGDARLRSLSKEYSASGKSATTLELIGLGVFNFDSDFSNSIYAKGGIGLYSVLNSTASDYENKFGLQIGGGKRFALFSNVTYNPEINLIKRGDIDFAIEIKLINLGVSW